MLLVISVENLNKFLILSENMNTIGSVQCIEVIPMCILEL